MLAYRYAKRLKTLRGLMPHEFICVEWERSPERFVRGPIHDTLGLYT